MIYYLDNNFRPTDQKHAIIAEVVSGNGVTVFVPVQNLQVQKSVNNNPEFNQKHPRGLAGKFSDKPKTVTVLRNSAKISEVHQYMKELEITDYTIARKNNSMTYLNTETGKEVKVPMLAGYSPRKGNIVVFPAAFKSKQYSIKAIIAHEAGHSHFYKIAKHVVGIMDSSEKLWTPAEKTFATLYSNKEKIAELPPPTDYSRMHWEAYSKDPSFYTKAVNETFAEMNRLYHTDQQEYYTAHPVWRALHKSGMDISRSIK